MTNRSTEEKHLIHSSVRRFLLLKMRPEDIVKALADPDAMDGHPVSMSVRTLYRHLEHLRKDDEKWMAKLAQGGFILEYRVAVETIAAQEQKLMRIVESANRDSDKIAASIAIKDLELERINLLADGPTLFAIKRQDAKAKAQVVPSSTTQP